MIDTARELSCRLADLLRREHLAMADFLLALADFDRQKGWRDLGYAGLFPYLHRELGLSKAAAFYRKTAAELVQRFPEVVEPLRAGELCITSVVELAKVLTPGNRAEVLPRFLRCSKQEAKAVAAELAPTKAFCGAADHGGRAPPRPRHPMPFDATPVRSSCTLTTRDGRTSSSRPGRLELHQRVTAPAVDVAIRRGIDLIGADDARAWFTHCGYEVRAK